MIYYGQGAQPIRWVPMDALGHPRSVSATYSVVDLREPETSSLREVVASTAATASAVSTTTTAAVGPDTANPKRIALTSVSDVRVGGVYLLTDGTVVESITIGSINASGLEVEATRAITRVLASGATFVGLEVEGEFPASVANDEDRLTNGGGPFLAVWQYTIGEQAYVAPQELWLTRYGMAPWVTFDDCARHLPGLAQYVGDAVDPVEAIRGATDEFFERLLNTSTWRRDPSYFRGNLSADLFIRKRAIAAMLLGGRGENSVELSRDFRDQSEVHVHNLTEGRPPTRATAIDVDTNTATPGGEKHPASRLFVRP